jgi:hypothetical protein
VIICPASREVKKIAGDKDITLLMTDVQIAGHGWI